MKRRREMEKKESEISCAIKELSNLILSNSKLNISEHKTTNSSTNQEEDDIILLNTTTSVADCGDGDDNNNNDDEEHKTDNSSTNFITNTHVPIKPFLSICTLPLKILDKIGPTMAVLRQDIHHNMQRLEKFYETDPELYSNIVEILKKEAKESRAKKKSSCSKAFLWLTRALDFSVALLQAMVKDLGLNMEKVVEESYNTTLKQWHGWISSAAYRVALKLLPDNKTMIAILSAKDEENESIKEENGRLKEEMETLVSLLVPVLEEIHCILREYELDILKGA